MNDLLLKCRCGEVEGVLTDISPTNCIHLVCYCDDCQAFAHQLGHDADILDEHGGTEVVQITPRQIRVNAGIDHLKSMRLRPGGLLRWHTDCSNGYSRYKRPFPKSIEYPQVTRQPSNDRRLALQRDAGLNSAVPAGGSLHASAIFRPVSAGRPTPILPLPSGSQPLVLVA